MQATNTASQPQDAPTTERAGTVAEVLDPLCRATASKLEPPDLDPHDYVLLDVDSEGRRFKAHLVSLQPLAVARDRSSAPSQRYFVRGEEMCQTWRGPSQGAWQFFERFPEAYHLALKDEKRRGQWLLSGTDYTALVLYHAWPPDRLVFVSEEARLLYRYLLARFFRQNDRAIKAAAYKLRDEMPPEPSTWVAHKTLPLSKYQQAAASLAYGQEGYALFMDRGTGKTATVVQRICAEAKRKREASEGMYRALVVCPPQVRTNWACEVRRFATVSGKVTVVRGGQVERLKQLALAVRTEPDCDFSIAVIGYDGLVATLEAFAKVQWDIVVSDESHAFKDPATKRAKAMLRLRNSAKARMALTGTPVGNSLMDLWSQLEFLGEGMSGFSSFKLFKRCHGVFEQVDGGATGVARLAGVRNLPMLQERLARVSFSVTKAEACLQLPDKVYDVEEVEMTPLQAMVYQQVSEELFAEIEQTLSRPHSAITVDNILTRLLRLAQITSGFVTWDAVPDLDTGEVLQPKRVEQIAHPNPKVEAIVKMVTDEERDPLGKTIVWCCWVEDIRTLSRRLTEAGVEHGTYYGATSDRDREECVRRFNCDPRFKVMIANPQTAGEGLNLLGYDATKPEKEREQTYCDHEVFMSQNWSAILRGQAEDRAHRRGTRMPLRITDLVVPGSIDEEIRRRVRDKRNMAETVTDVREILRSVLGARPLGQEN